MSVRNKKTNKAQMEMIVNFLEQNRVLVTGKTHPLNPSELDDKWEELTVLLNTVENGARKEKKQWKTYLYEWKSKTKKKARLNYNSIRQTGGGGYICTDLGDLENRLMAIFGWIHIIGCPEAPPEVDPDGEEVENIEIILMEANNGSQSPELSIENDIPIIQPETATSKKNEAGATFPKIPIPQRKKKVKTISSSTKLENYAMLYSHSTEQMAIAVKEMAAAISQLAEALSNITTALIKENTSFKP
ncbi:unnamed protein product [Phaedon cochleariae]|uniref:Regulatory protein zeste n=1 Tax=Phaedon cochleariae TaxID=80249 RepID=A0A9N9SFR6_PHACE|nr:unnamed protein product [Phaedon cochleariae]